MLVERRSTLRSLHLVAHLGDPRPTIWRADTPAVARGALSRLVGPGAQQAANGDELAEVVCVVIGDQ